MFTHALLISLMALSADVAPVDAIAYKPLSAEAERTGQLARYSMGCPSTAVRLETAGSVLEAQTPVDTRAYDVVPVRYHLKTPAGAGRVFVVATAFEEEARTNGAPLYDMNVPGDLKVRIEYLGSICADYAMAAWKPMREADSPRTDAMPIKRDPEVCSGVIRPAEMVWFKFRVTNTGDTIMDPDGMGTTFAFPQLTRLDAQGGVEFTATTVNQYERHLNYVYPGESFEQWVSFWCPQMPEGKRHGLASGKYKLEMNYCFKDWRAFNWGLNIWHGSGFARLTMPLEVTPNPVITPPAPTEAAWTEGVMAPGIYTDFEEFMSGFQMHPASDTAQEVDGVVHVQVAPWTKHIAIKLISAAPQSIAIQRVPVTVSDETLRITYNPKNPMVIRGEDGREEPVILAMAMPGMRSGFQLGPWPEDHLRRQMRDLKDAGFNLLCNTAGNWYHAEFMGGKEINPLSETYKFWYDTVMRESGMKCLAWSVYPPNSYTWDEFAAKCLNKKLDTVKTTSAYGDTTGVDFADPHMPEIIAACVKHHFDRWGDYWFKTPDGRVPVDIEDSWGWLRDDINVRYGLGAIGVARFRAWLETRYGDIAAVNAAWGTSYAAFGAIDPQADQGVEGDGMPHGPVYNNPDNPFHDWTPAVEDWDRFRTELRMEVYAETNRLIQEFLPGGELALRTEGANLVIPGSKDSPDMHWRHVYYSQRRNAMMFDVVKEKNVLHFYSDYTSLPYTETEWRQGMREMTAVGVIPLFLPMFNRMRDIVLNPYYGREYKVNYGLDAPSKGMMVMPITAAYPWWKAAYEEGGAPGIIWQDFLCDSFGTETQLKEAKLLREYLQKALAAAGK